MADDNDAIVSDACDIDNTDDVVDCAVDDGAGEDKSYIDLAQAKNAQAADCYQVANNAKDADQRNQQVEAGNAYDNQADTILKNGNTIENAWTGLKLWANNIFSGTYIPATHQGDPDIYSQQQIYNWAYDIARAHSRGDVARVYNLLGSRYKDLASKQMIQQALLDVYYGKARNPPQPHVQHERTMPVRESAVAHDAAAASTAQQWRDFYVKTRRYAAGLAWQALNDQFYQHALEGQSSSPTLTTQLQLKAYTHEIIARYRHGKAS